METFVVLPTLEAFQLFGSEDYRVVFYADGIEGLIRDHILITDPSMTDYACEDDPLKQAIIDSYMNSLIFKQEDIAGRTDINISSALELSGEVRRWVNAMMRDIYPLEFYRIHEQYWAWLGYDIHIRIDVMEE